MLHVVIMAGGSGTRFWPASRADRPKQLLPLAAGRSLLRATYERVAPLVPPERLWVVATSATAAATAAALPELLPTRLLAEPVGRDTAACAGLAALAVSRDDPGAVCVVLPADHLIGDEDAFRASLLAGAEQVAGEGGLLTFGVRPTRPETGYGYLELGSLHGERAGFSVHHLDRFVEKPDAGRARAYLERGGFLWNSGVFAWRAAELLDEIARQIPELHGGLERIAGGFGRPDEGVLLAELYPGLPRTSVDFGVMEGAESRWTIPVDYPWSDVGSWPAAAELLPTDEDGNTLAGRCLALDAHDNVVVGEGPVVTVAGVESLIVVATPDAVLVVPRNEAQRVKGIVEAVRRRGWDEVL